MSTSMEIEPNAPAVASEANGGSDAGVDREETMRYAARYRELSEGGRYV